MSDSQDWFLKRPRLEVVNRKDLSRVDMFLFYSYNFYQNYKFVVKRKQNWYIYPIQSQSCKTNVHPSSYQFRLSKDMTNWASIIGIGYSIKCQAMLQKQVNFKTYNCHTPATGLENHCPHQIGFPFLSLKCLPTKGFLCFWFTANQPSWKPNVITVGYADHILYQIYVWPLDAHSFCESQTEGNGWFGRLSNTMSGVPMPPWTQSSWGFLSFFSLCVHAVT